MDNNNNSNGAQAGVMIGWFVLATAITKIPGIVTGTFLNEITPGIGGKLIWMNAPVAILLMLGAIGLILRKHFGYYCVYIATFFGAIGGLKSPYLPFINRYVNIGPATDDLFLVLNLLIVGVLAWEHWGRITELNPEAHQKNQVALAALFIVGMITIGVGRSMVHWEFGQLKSASEMPLLGSEISALETTGALHYALFHAKHNSSLLLVTSGKTSEAGVQKMVDQYHLTKIEKPEGQKKFCPLTRKWKLNKDKYWLEYKPTDLFYVGRMKKKGVFEIVFNKAEGRFTAEFLGSLAD